jgi:hypothetical protein
LDDLFSDSILFKLNFIGIQHLEYLNIREIRTPEKPLTLQKGQGFVGGYKILTLTLTLLTPTLDPWRVDKPLHITTGGVVKECYSQELGDYSNVSLGHLQW